MGYFLFMLTKEQVSTFEEKLRAEKANIIEQLARMKENLDFGNEIDSLDEEADESEEFANQVGIKKAIEDRLGRITSALEKIARGTYGTCEKCGNPISMKLLEVDPESVLCQTCKAVSPEM